MQGKSDESFSDGVAWGMSRCAVSLTRRFGEARARRVAVGASSSSISFFFTLEECRASEGFGLLGAVRDRDIWDVEARHALARQSRRC